MQALFSLLYGYKDFSYFYQNNFLKKYDRFQFLSHTLATRCKFENGQPINQSIMPPHKLHIVYRKKILYDVTV